MPLKSLLAIVVCLFVCPVGLSVEPTNTARGVHVGDSVLLELTGEPAIAMLRLTNSKSYDAVKNGRIEFCMPLEGKVVAINEAGEILVQYQSQPSLDAEDPRMITLAARIGRSQIKPASLYPEPKSPVTRTQLERQLLETQARQARLPKVRLEGMKGVRLCAWKMVDEVAE